MHAVRRHVENEVALLPASLIKLEELVPAAVDLRLGRFIGVAHALDLAFDVVILDQLFELLGDLELVVDGRGVASSHGVVLELLVRVHDANQDDACVLALSDEPTWVELEASVADLLECRIRLFNLVLPHRKRFVEIVYDGEFHSEIAVFRYELQLKWGFVSFRNLD